MKSNALLEDNSWTSDLSDSEINDFFRALNPDSWFLFSKEAARLSIFEKEELIALVRRFEFPEGGPEEPRDFAIVKSRSQALFYFSIVGTGDAKVLTIGKLLEFS